MLASAQVHCRNATARGDRDRKVPQAKNDSFLPSWHPVPGARSVRSPVRQPSDLPLHLPERRRRRTEQRATGSRAADAIPIKHDRRAALRSRGERGCGMLHPEASRKRSHCTGGSWRAKAQPERAWKTCCTPRALYYRSIVL